MAKKDLLGRSRIQNIDLDPISLVQSSDLEYIYGNIISDNDNLATILQIYIAEPPLRIDLNP